MFARRMGGPRPTHQASLRRGAYSALFGLEILVVEDEALVLMSLEDMLAEFGCVVAGTASSVSDALSAIMTSDGLDAAILDVNLLDGEKVYPVADILAERGVPLVFSTAFAGADILDRYPQGRLLKKPYTPEALAEMLIEVAYDQRH